jgi:hypothetical protein
LTGGKRAPDNADNLIVTRAALALELALSVVPPSGPREFLLGVFTWVATGLNEPGSRHDRAWLDLGVRLEAAKEWLNRVFMARPDSALALHPLLPLTGMLHSPNWRVPSGSMSKGRLYWLIAMKRG